jgi:hypothetical protein
MVTTPTPTVALPVRPNRLLAAALAAAVIAGGAVIASSADDAVAPTKPSAAPAGSVVFGDPPVVKGARGGNTNVVTLRVFNDPTVRKGAGGR